MLDMTPSHLDSPTRDDAAMPPPTMPLAPRTSGPTPVRVVAYAVVIVGGIALGLVLGLIAALMSGRADMMIC